MGQGSGTLWRVSKRGGKKLAWLQKTVSNPPTSLKDSNSGVGLDQTHRIGQVLNDAANLGTVRAWRKAPTIGRRRIPLTGLLQQAPVIWDLANVCSTESTVVLLSEVSRGGGT
jgi:hypothetical protein